MTRPPTDRRYTVLVVPERGQGDVRQIALSERRVRRAAVGAAGLVALLAVGAGAAGWAVPRALRSDAVEAENAELVARLDALTHRVEEMDALVARVAALDDQLRGAARAGVLPGSGPWTAAEQGAFEAWLDDRAAPSDFGLTGTPVERARALAARADAVAAELDALENVLPGLQDEIVALRARDTALPDRWPLHGTLTSPYGWRPFPFGGHLSFHTGIDIGVPEGTPIVATAPGIVVRSDGDAGRGRTVVLDHGSGVLTRYGHCSLLLLDVGDEVYAGDIIALSGNTGRSTGPHLHYDLFIDGEAVDPLDYLP